MFCIVDTASHRPDDHRCFIGFGPPRLDVPPRPSGHTSKKRPSSSTATISPPLRFISPSLASPCRASTPKKHSDEQHNAWKADGSCVRPSGRKPKQVRFVRGPFPMCLDPRPPFAGGYWRFSQNQTLLFVSTNAPARFSDQPFQGRSFDPRRGKKCRRQCSSALQRAEENSK